MKERPRHTEKKKKTTKELQSVTQVALSLQNEGKVYQ